MEYSYYLNNYNGINTLYRIRGKIHGNASSLEAYYNGCWSNDSKLINSFMNRYVTGWLNEDDALHYKEAIKMLCAKIDHAKSFAIEKHGDQKYGTFHYEIHLINVLNVLVRNNILPNSERNIDLWISAWLHDILEDTETSGQELADEFGDNIYETVWALTDEGAGNRNEKKQMMYKKLVLNQDGIIIKLADRIANLEFSIINGSKEKIEMYISENKELNSQLSDVITTKLGTQLLSYLNNLVETLN